MEIVCVAPIRKIHERNGGNAEEVEGGGEGRNSVAMEGQEVRAGAGTAEGIPGDRVVQ